MIVFYPLVIQYVVPLLTRCSLQTGRAPIHVNVQNVLPESTNARDPIGGWQGIPLRMSGVAQLLSRAGYSCHAIGK